jgi:hypothetical protein
MARARSRKKVKELVDKKSLDSFKAFLGPIAARYSDAQLIQLRCDMRAAARLLLDLYFLKKYPVESVRSAFDKPEAET